MLPMPFIWPDPAPGLKYANMINIHDFFPLNFPTWSLFFEIVINLGYVLIAPYLTDRVLTLLMGASFIGLTCIGYTFGTLDQGTQRHQFFGASARVTFGFCIGTVQSRSWLARKSKISFHPMFLFILLWLPLVLKPDGSTLAWLYDLAIVGIYMPILLWLGASSSPSETWLSASRVLGILSYPICVIHVPIWNSLRASYGWQGNEILHKYEPWSGFVLVIVLCIIAWSMDKFVDRPTRRLLSNILLWQMT